MWLYNITTLVPAAEQVGRVLKAYHQRAERMEQMYARFEKERRRNRQELLQDDSN
jgi:hypothetical protein